MAKLKICIVLLYALLMVEAQGPDPWDGENGIKFSVNANKNTDTPTVNPPSDIFYKRILQLLVNRGRFKSTSNELLNGYLHFEFSTKEFDLLKSYSSLTHPLNAKELREIDGLLADRLIFPSIAQIYAENFVDVSLKFLKIYYIHLIFGVAFIMILYSFRNVDWKLVFTIRSLLILFFFVSLLWEAKLQIEKSNVIEYKKISWWKFWEKDNEIVFNDIKSIYEILHPVDIVGNVVSKIIFQPMTGFMNLLDKYVLQMSDKFTMPFNSLVYMFITMSYFIIIIIFCCSLLFYLIFGVAIDLSYLGFRASFKNQNLKSTEPSENNSIQNNIPAISYKKKSKKNEKKPGFVTWSKRK